MSSQRAPTIVSLILLVLQTAGCATRELAVSGETLQKQLTTAPDGNQIALLALQRVQDGKYFIEVKFASRHVVHVVPKSEVFIDGFTEGTSPLPKALTVPMLYLREGRSPVPSGNRLILIFFASAESDDGRAKRVFRATTSPPN